MATLYLTPFGKNDPKLSFALDSVEPRIHFALNCGAKSCPPIKTFTTEHVENELATATGKTHALKKYDQLALNTSCFWGSTG